MPIMPYTTILSDQSSPFSSPDDGISSTFSSLPHAIRTCDSACIPLFRWGRSRSPLGVARIAMYSRGHGCGSGGTINFGCRPVVCVEGMGDELLDGVSEGGGLDAAGLMGLVKKRFMLIVRHGHGTRQSIWTLLAMTQRTRCQPGRRVSV